MPAKETPVVVPGRAGLALLEECGQSPALRPAGDDVTAAAAAYGSSTFESGTP